MKGHVRRRGKGWAYVVDATPGPDGKRRQQWKSGFPTRKEAERALAEAVKAINDGAYVQPSRETIGAFLENEWLPAVAARLRPSTLASYRTIVRVQIVPRIGGTPLQALTPATLNRLYGELQRSGRSKGAGGGLSARSVRLTHAVIRKALADAVRWGKVVRNVADLADPPSQSAERAARRAAMTTWTVEQLGRFLAHTSTDRLAVAWRFAAMTGVRRGELAGLLWRDVDLDGGRVAICRALVSVDFDVQTSETKSGKTRVIDLDAATVAALRDHRRQQLKDRLAWEGAWEDHDLVFCQENGSPIHPEQWTRTFKRHAAAAGLPAIRLHDLRHTHGSLLVASGVHPKVVQERLGHHSSAFTMDVYAHVMPAQQAEAAAVLAAAIGGHRG